MNGFERRALAAKIVERVQETLHEHPGLKAEFFVMDGYEYKGVWDCVQERVEEELCK